MTDLTYDVSFRPTGLARGEQGLLGRAVDRVEGPLKVTGQAPYTGEREAEDTLYGVVLASTIGHGRVIAIDAGRAEVMPGVIAVIVDHPHLPSGGANGRDPALRGPTWRIDQYGQPLGLVVADTVETARAAARLVDIAYDEEPGRFDPRAVPVDPDHGEGFLSPVHQGDLDAALAGAAVVIDQTYTTPVHFPHALEPHATVAEWRGDRLLIRASLQMLDDARRTVAASLHMDADAVRVLAPFVGGGFGCKGGAGPELVLAAIAARHTGRPVEVRLPRRQHATLVHHRSETVQRMRLAADRDGRLLAIAQDSVVSQKEDRGFVEPVPFGSIPLYAAPVRRFITALARVNLPPCGAVRAPGEAVGSFGLEGAMDELAVELGLDPVELRRRNEPAADPTSGKPFSARRLLDCYDEGARRFGWDRRDPTPGSVRDGEWLVGMGMAAALRGNFTVQAEARVTLGPDARALVETDMTDIGTGTYTILTQVAGEMLGLPVAAVDVVLGDTDLPRSPGSGGSWGAGASASAVALACEDILAELARRMNAAPDELTLRDGCVTAGGRQVPLVDLLRGEALTGAGHLRPGKAARETSQASHGAQFAEVAVNAVTGEVRVRRLLGVFEAGRILNEKTARSQMIGGMIWAQAYALSEDAVVDARTGLFVNPDFGEYHVAVNADIGHIEVHFLGEPDDLANPVGAKGIGELGIAGAGAAIANAVYNACGVRVRDMPITPDKLLAGLPPI